MMDYIFAILSLVLVFVTPSFADYEEINSGSHRQLHPSGSNVCSHKETRAVQVNTSFIDVTVVPVRERYTTYFWGIPRYRTRIVMREKMVIKYRMETKLKDVDVYFCCDGWAHAEGSKECKRPVCPIGCDNGGVCTAPDTCTCKSGFEGKFCQNDINECKDITRNKCEQGCINTRGGFECYCKRGFIRDPENPTKCLDIDECRALPCKCPPTDLKCSASCTNTRGSYKCTCGKGYRYYPDGTCRDINECVQNVCSQFCVNLPGSYRCDCMLGFMLNISTAECMDINECEIQNGGCNQKCHNTEGDYVCSCNENFYLTEDGKTCEVVKNFTRFSRLCAKGYQSYDLLSCWPSTVKIVSAFYGRVTDSHCQGDSKSFTPCSVNGITEFLKKKCSGKDTCFVDASKESLRSLGDPCPNVDKYVEIISTCAGTGIQPQ